LPDPLRRASEKIREAIGFSAEVADAKHSRQRRRMQQDSAGTRKSHAPDPTMFRCSSFASMRRVRVFRNLIATSRGCRGVTRIDGVILQQMRTGNEAEGP